MSTESREKAADYAAENLQAKTEIEFIQLLRIVGAIIEIASQVPDLSEMRKRIYDEYYNLEPHDTYKIRLYGQIETLDMLASKGIITLNNIGK